jgi:hypothetical protein
MTATAIDWPALRFGPVNLWTVTPLFRQEIKHMAKQGTAADIKRFVGYTTPDGITFATLKDANQHVIDEKTKAALQQAFGSVTPASDKSGQITADDRDNFVLHVDEIPAFLFAHREQILAAFKQEVRMRAKPAGATPRKPRADKSPKQPAAPQVDPSLTVSARDEEMQAL